MCSFNNLTGQSDKGGKDNNQSTLKKDTKSETITEEKETSKDMDVDKRTLPVNESDQCAPGSDPNQKKPRPGVPENRTNTTISNLESEKQEKTESSQPIFSNEVIGIKDYFTIEIQAHFYQLCYVCIRNVMEL